MNDQAHFSPEDARVAGEQIGIVWATSPFDVDQFRMGMDVELVMARRTSRPTSPTTM